MVVLEVVVLELVVEVVVVGSGADVVGAVDMVDVVGWDTVVLVEDGGVAARPARWRNVAISPLVSKASGQNRLLSGGLQPRVMAAPARAEMSAAKT